jgi:uncharacterized tellurite resistance protein B-like protein
MEMDALTPEEDLALIGLLKAVIQADKQLSFEENEALKRVSAQMGPDRFHERVSEAKELFKTLSDIKAHAQTIERPEARQLIFAHAKEMARQDGVIEEEEDILSWLAETWGVEYFRR